MMESSFTTVNVYLLDCLLEGLNERFHGKQQSFINEWHDFFFIGCKVVINLLYIMSKEFLLGH